MKYFATGLLLLCAIVVGCEKDKREVPPLSEAKALAGGNSLPETFFDLCVEGDAQACETVMLRAAHAEEGNMDQLLELLCLTPQYAVLCGGTTHILTDPGCSAGMGVFCMEDPDVLCRSGRSLYSCGSSTTEPELLSYGYSERISSFASAVGRATGRGRGLVDANLCEQGDWTACDDSTFSAELSRRLAIARQR